MPLSVIACTTAGLHTTIFVTMTEATVYHMLQDLRLLARRDSTERQPCVDPKLEEFRLQFVEAFEAWMDGCEASNLTPFVVTGKRIITGNKDLLNWLKKELDQLN